MFAPKVAKAQMKAPDNPTRKLAPQPSTLGARPFGGGAVGQAQMLQGTIGNQAMLRYLTQRLSNPPAKGPAERHVQEASGEHDSPRGTAGPSWDFSKIPVFPSDRADRPQPSYRSLQRHSQAQYRRSSLSGRPTIRLSMRRTTSPTK